MMRTIALLSVALLVAPYVSAQDCCTQTECTTAPAAKVSADCPCDPCECDPCLCSKECTEPCDSKCETACTKSKRCPCSDFSDRYVAAGCGSAEQVDAFLESLSEAEFGEFVARLESAEAPLSEELANKISAALNIDANALPEISCSSCK